jgi:hypothetical protein
MLLLVFVFTNLRNTVIFLSDIGILAPFQRRAPLPREHTGSRGGS